MDSLPVEILSIVLEHLHPTDYGSFAATSQKLGYAAERERPYYLKKFKSGVIGFNRLLPYFGKRSIYRSQPLLKKFFPPHVAALNNFINWYSTFDFLYAKVNMYDNIPEGIFSMISSRSNPPEKINITGTFANGLLTGTYELHLVGNEIFHIMANFRRGKAHGVVIYICNKRLRIQNYNMGEKVGIWPIYEWKEDTPIDINYNFQLLTDPFVQVDSRFTFESYDEYLKNKIYHNNIHKSTTNVSIIDHVDGFRIAKRYEIKEDKSPVIIYDSEKDDLIEVNEYRSLGNLVSIITYDNENDELLDVIFFSGRQVIAKIANKVILKNNNYLRSKSIFTLLNGKEATEDEATAMGKYFTPYPNSFCHRFYYNEFFIDVEYEEDGSIGRMKVYKGGQVRFSS